MISDSVNAILLAIPTMEEVKNAVFDIDHNSSASPNGFNSNVSQKLVSEVLNDRLEKILPNLISDNQSDFIKGRTIRVKMCY